MSTIVGDFWQLGSDPAQSLRSNPRIRMRGWHVVVAAEFLSWLVQGQGVRPGVNTFDWLVALRARRWSNPSGGYLYVVFIPSLQVDGKDF